MKTKIFNTAHEVKKAFKSKQDIISVNGVSLEKALLKVSNTAITIENHRGITVLKAPYTVSF